jgi:hypothetical protein
MEGFVDADWASDADSRRSIGGYVFTCCVQKARRKRCG